jgi:hypothetical protein
MAGMTGSSRAARRGVDFEGGRWHYALSHGRGAMSCAYCALRADVLFEKLLHVPWPPSLLGDAFPDLRDLSGRLI